MNGLALVDPGLKTIQIFTKSKIKCLNHLEIGKPNLKLFSKQKIYGKLFVFRTRYTQFVCANENMMAFVLISVCLLNVCICNMYKNG